ncbi:MAG: helix-turn-helix domain-containing protein [Planctomycetota bacterium]
MAPLTRKQREIADRELLILEVARGMMVERGYLGLTMDRIAGATEYSKGTIYQHFSCKEEVLAALACESAQIRTSLFERAATFPGRARERMAAVGVADFLFVRLYPQHFAIERICDTASMRDKIPEKRLSRLESCEDGCKSVVLGLARDAMAQGDLGAEDPSVAGQVVFGLWSMAYGANLISTSPGVDLETKMGIAEPWDVLFRNYNALLDGYGWKPLAGEWDYAATLERIYAEVFPDEIRRLADR